MLSLVDYLLIGIGVIVLLVVTIFLVGGYNPYTPPAPTPDQFTSLYQPTSPWGWNATQSAVPVSGISGSCNVYTFVSTKQYTPALVSFASIYECTGTGTTLCSAPQPGQTCVDPDQLFAQQFQHKCLGDLNLEVHTTGQCREQDGTLVDPDVIEVFFSPCGSQTTTQAATPASSNICPGSLSLIAFNANIGTIGPTVLDPAFCVRDPDYVITTDPTTGARTYSNLSPLLGVDCSMSDAYMGYPRQLFRVERADWNGQAFVPDQSGTFARIIHRPTGYAIGPGLTNNNPKLPNVGAPLQLTSTAVLSSGYWWGLIPQLSDPTYTGGSGPHYIGRPQFVYIVDPNLVPSVSDTTSLWNFVTSKTSVIYSISPSSNVKGTTLITVPYIVTDTNAPSNGATDPQAASKLASAQYLDYSIVPIILADPAAFDFYGPFPAPT